MFGMSITILDNFTHNIIDLTNWFIDFLKNIWKVFFLIEDKEC
jgi:hypothetical protein